MGKPFLESYMTIHMNDVVRVRLTDYGREVDMEFDRQLHERVPAIITPYKPAREDSDGRRLSSLWSLMRRFGPYASPAAPVLFHGGIEVLSDG
tara:strand:+ start:238 stop:516 length:279 start_codon:yes stop_codon:yes gene_type:complete